MHLETKNVRAVTSVKISDLECEIRGKYQELKYDLEDQLKIWLQVVKEDIGTIAYSLEFHNRNED